MASYTNDDRNMLDAETRLWAVSQILDDVSAGAWSKTINKLAEEALELACELRDYNDQFEEEE